MSKGEPPAPQKVPTSVNSTSSAVNLGRPSSTFTSLRSDISRTATAGSSSSRLHSRGSRVTNPSRTATFGSFPSKKSRPSSSYSRYSSIGLSAESPIEIDLDSDDSPPPPPTTERGDGRALAATDSLKSSSSTSSPSVKCLGHSPPPAMPRPGRQRSGELSRSQLYENRHASNDSDVERPRQVVDKGKGPVLGERRDTHVGVRPSTSVSPSKPISPHPTSNKPPSSNLPASAIGPSGQAHPSFLRTPVKPKTSLPGHSNDTSIAALMKTERISARTASREDVIATGSRKSTTVSPAKHERIGSVQMERTTSDRSSSSGKSVPIANTRMPSQVAHSQSKDRQRSITASQSPGKRAYTPKPTLNEWRIQIAEMKREKEKLDAELARHRAVLEEAFAADERDTKGKGKESARPSSRVEDRSKPHVPVQTKMVDGTARTQLQQSTPVLKPPSQTPRQLPSSSTKSVQRTLNSKGPLDGSPVTPVPTTSRFSIAASASTSKNKRQKTDPDDLPYRPKTQNRSLSNPASTDKRDHSNNSEAGPSARPHRARPEPGAYALPAIDTPIHDWPNDRSYSANSQDGEPKRPVHPAARASNKSQASTKPHDSPMGKQQIRSTEKRPEDRASTQASRPSQIARSESTLTPLSSPDKTPSQALSASLPPSKRPLPLDLSPTKQRSPLKALNKGNTASPRSPQKRKNKSPDAEAVEQDEMDFDILAEFEGYTWATSPETKTKGLEDVAGVELNVPPAVSLTNVPGITSPIEEPSVSATAPTSAATTTSPAVALPTSLSSTKAQATDPRPAFPTTPRKRARSASPPIPTSVHKRRAQANEYNQMVEAEKARLAAEREETKAEEERKLRIVADALEEEESEEEDQADLGAFLDTLKESPEKTSPTKQNAPSAIGAVRQRAEDRQTKLEVQAAQRKAKRHDEERRKRQASLNKQQRDQLRQFDKMLRANKASGLTSETLKLLAAEDLGEGEWAYPTPDSASFGSSENGSSAGEEGGEMGSETEPDLDLDQLAGQLRNEGMELDEELLRDAKMAERLEDGPQLLEWEGFWAKEHRGKTTTEEKDPLPELDVDTDDETLVYVKQLADEGDSSTLAAVISTGVPRSAPDHLLSPICDWLLASALQSSHIQWREVALSSLLSLMDQSPPDWEYAAIALSVLSTLGARESIVPSASLRTRAEWPTVRCEREWGCGVVCRLVAQAAPLSIDQTRQLIPVLLLLSIDSSTSSSLKREISDTLSCLLAGFNGENTVEIARAIITSAENYEVDAYVALLQMVGQRTRERANVSRWLGLGWLIPGSLDALDPSETPTVPRISSLLASSNLILEYVRPSATKEDQQEPNYTHLNHLVTLLYASMSDMDALVGLHPPDLSGFLERVGHGKEAVKEMMAVHPFEEVRRVLRQARDKISDQSNGTLKSLVKARLHQLTEITRLKLSLALKKRVRAERPGAGASALGKNLERGAKGQTRLSFGPAAKVEERD